MLDTRRIKTIFVYFFMDSVKVEVDYLTVHTKLGS